MISVNVFDKYYRKNEATGPPTDRTKLVEGAAVYLSLEDWRTAEQAINSCIRLLDAVGETSGGFASFYLADVKKTPQGYTRLIREVIGKAARLLDRQPPKISAALCDALIRQQPSRVPAGSRVSTFGFAKVVTPGGFGPGVTLDAAHSSKADHRSGGWSGFGDQSTGDARTASGLGVKFGRRASHASRGEARRGAQWQLRRQNVPQSIPQTYHNGLWQPPLSNTVAKLIGMHPSNVVHLRYKIRYSKKGLSWSKPASEWQKRRVKPWRSWPKSITMGMRPQHSQKRYSGTMHWRLMRSKSWGGWPSGNMAKRVVQSVRIQSTVRRRLLRLRQADALGESCTARSVQNDALIGFDKYYYRKQ